MNFNTPYNINNYWNPLSLSKTNSYENLSLEDKVIKLEEQVKEIQTNNDLVSKIYQSRMSELIDLDLDYVREFYEESPNFGTNNGLISMVNTLSWLSYSEEEKKRILDEDITKHFLP